ncbi:hypothetical protein P5673_029810 [Acropora cervicornis]|uniref:Uncharacterized protein n=1 Tax=Acropora cervicornis TaxID=6130 RepID=A0AAD9PV73_ACRCE|nr:hypothetical protein P5673_029810 [Acropora cervicornis]
MLLSQTTTVDTEQRRSSFIFETERNSLLLDRKTSFSFSRARGPGEEIIEKGPTICSMYH